MVGGVHAQVTVPVEEGEPAPPGIERWVDRNFDDVEPYASVVADGQDSESILLGGEWGLQLRLSLDVETEEKLVEPLLTDVEALDDGVVVDA